MAEKKTTKRTPKQSKAEITKPEVAEVAEPKEEITEVAEPEVELREEVTEPEVEGTELPADTTPFEEFEASSEVTEPEVKIAKPEEEVAKFEKAASSPKVAAKIKKLNPYLEDFQSKWIAILEVNGLTHKLFKGSYAKALNAAENYNISHGIGKGQVTKIRK